MTLDMTTAALTAALVVPLSVTAALLLQRLLRQRHQLDPSALVRKLRIDDPGRPLESIAEDFVNVIRHASGSQHAFIILLDRFNHVVFRQAGNVTPTAQSLIRRAPAVIPLMNRTQAPDAVGPCAVFS
ncbi:MAG: hypothetical protein HY042_01410 [Spirochaetia bacterium]|nr:hypothetical protein [Spirochaetia bacterium]